MHKVVKKKYLLKICFHSFILFRCRDGWQGAGCHECKRYPGCVHGTCNAPFKCDCKNGWGGWQCDKDLNFCTNHRPCKNGATCLNTGEDYTCSCPIGFSGRNCEVRVQNKCLENPCKNDGECLVSLIFTFLHTIFCRPIVFNNPMKACYSN